MGKRLTRCIGNLIVLGAAVAGGTIGVAAVAAAPAAAATVITVNDPRDLGSPTPGNCVTSPEGDCNLRGALEEATALGADVTINLPDPSSLTPSSGAYFVDSAIGELSVNDTGQSITLVGAGASSVDIQAGCNGTGCTPSVRVMEIQPGTTADISGVTVSGRNTLRPNSATAAASATTAT